MSGGDQTSVAQKATIHDIARVSGVSLATVDRVLNRRSGVREATIEKVNKAIKDLGYVRDAAAVNLARRRFLKLQFVIPDTQNEFVQALEADLKMQSGKLLHNRVEIGVIRVPPFDATAMADALDSLVSEQTDGVAVFGPETPSVRDAIRRTRERGIPVVALVSDLPSSRRNRFVGINNVAAGRTAGRLMGRFIHDNGHILVITGSRFARDHIERRKGFDAVIASDFPHLEAVATIEGRDDPDVVLKILPDVFAAYPDLRGIYSSAAGNPGLIQFLEQTGRANDIVVVAHELTMSSRRALEEGIFDAIISQDTGHLVRSTTRVLIAAIDGAPIDDKQERIRIDIYLKDNMPMA